MDTFLIILLTFFAFFALEMMLYTIGGIFMRREPNIVILLKAIVVSAAMEGLRFLLAMLVVKTFHTYLSIEGLATIGGEGLARSNPIILWLVRVRILFIPILPTIAIISTVIPLINNLTIANCDICNNWTVPFGGSIYGRSSPFGMRVHGKSSGTPDLLCLKCLITKRFIGFIILPLVKIRAFFFWVFKGLWH
jgi:hypothetical protein